MKFNDWWARYTHSTAGLYAWRKSVMSSVRHTVAQIMGSDEISLKTFDLAWKGVYEEMMRNRSVLDVGCGTGEHSREVLEIGHAVRYVGVDVSVGLITSAASSFADSNFCVGDGSHLPFGDNSIDVVIMNFTLHHIEPNKRHLFLRDLLRVARQAVIVRDVSGVDAGLKRILYICYYTLLDGSYYRYTLNEWHRFFQSCEARVTHELHTEGGAVVHRHCCFVISKD